jgi:hypothetical protein
MLLRWFVAAKRVSRAAAGAKGVVCRDSRGKVCISGLSRRDGHDLPRLSRRRAYLAQSPARRAWFAAAHDSRTGSGTPWARDDAADAAADAVAVADAVADAVTDAAAVAVAVAVAVADAVAVAVAKIGAGSSPMCSRRSASSVAQFNPQPHGLPVPGQTPAGAVAAPPRPPSAAAPTRPGTESRSDACRAPHDGHVCAARRSSYFRRSSKAAPQLRQVYS